MCTVISIVKCTVDIIIFIFVFTRTFTSRTNKVSQLKLTLNTKVCL